MSNRRIDLDVRKLILSNYKTEIIDDDTRHIIVHFPGPVDTPYEGGLWKVNVELPNDYPYRSPSIGFINRIYHPNVEPTRGSVCLDVLNMTWTPIYGLLNIFEVFLPQLLSYPNADDPMNHDAGALWKKSQQHRNEDYASQVRNWVNLYARPKDVIGSSENLTEKPLGTNELAGEAVDSDSSMSSLDDLSAEEDE